jgi:hypothetical protein
MHVRASRLQSPVPCLTTASAAAMPPKHPNLDALIRNSTRNQLPSWHTQLSLWVGRIPKPSYTPYRCVSSVDTATKAAHWFPDASLARPRRAEFPYRSGTQRSKQPTEPTRRRRPRTRTCSSSSQVRLLPPSARAHLMRRLCSDILPVNHLNISVIVQNPSVYPMRSSHPAIDPWIGLIAKPAYTPYRCVTCEVAAAT